MSEEEIHETFEAVGSGASLTYPMQVSLENSLNWSLSEPSFFFDMENRLPKELGT